MDQLKEFSNPGNQFTDKEGVLAGGLFNAGKDVYKTNIDIAYRNKNTQKIGVKHGLRNNKMIDDASQPLEPTEGDDVVKFIKDSSSLLEEKFEDRLKDINEKLRISEQTKEAFKQEFDDSVPPPLANRLTEKQIRILLEDEKKRERFFKSKGELTKLFNTTFNEFGEMKPAFKGSVGFLTTQFGISKQLNTPLLIPLELELAIDGIGGIYPGNSFHSTYVPTKYQDSTVFQAFDINHRLDSTTWTTTITGKMRANLASVFVQGYRTLKEQLENYQAKAQINETKAQEIDAEKERQRNTSYYGGGIGLYLEETKKRGG